MWPSSRSALGGWYRNREFRSWQVAGKARLFRRRSAADLLALHGFDVHFLACGALPASVGDMFASASNAAGDGHRALRRDKTRWSPLAPSLDSTWAVLAVLLPVAGSLIRPTQALDLAYHIRAGEWMLDARSLLDFDVFTYTVPGEAWLNQQWGSQLALAGVYRLGGWFALDVLRGLIVGLTTFLMYRTCRAAGASSKTSSVLTIGGSLVALEILSSLRPQQFGFVLFALVLWCVTTRRDHAGRLWAVPAITLVWANVHGTFPLALMILAFAVIEDHRSAPATARRAALVFALSIVSTLLTPFGPAVWTYIVELSQHPIVSSRISEWQSPSAKSGTGTLFFVSAGLVVVLLARRAERVAWLPLVKILTYGGLSLLALRGVVWWGIAVPVVIAALIGDVAAERQSPRSPINVVAITSLAVLVVVAMGINRGTDPRTGAPAMLTYAPERLVASLRKEVPAGSAVFASQLHASWAELSAPDYLYAIDSRIELFSIEIWDEYTTVSGGREDWLAVLEADDVRALLLEPEQAKDLIAVLQIHPEWRMVEATDDGSLYVRT